MSDCITKKIQKIDLETYRVFSRLCQECNLRHYAISGTALGQSLWQGFIPWDDDMDIAMPVEDFERFRTKLYKKLPKEYAFVELPWLGGKIYDVRTTLIEAPYTSCPEKFIGVFLDIVPLIGVPDDEREREEFVEEVKRYYVEAMAIERAPEMGLFSGLSATEIEKWRKKLTTRCPFGTTKYCIDLSNLKGSLYLTEGFLNYEMGQFEDLKIPISKNQDEDLKVAYGNIMKHVPESERRLDHHEFYNVCDLKKSCISYREAYKKVPEWFRKAAYKNHLFESAAMREALLYKIYCKKLEGEVRELKDDVRKLRSSKSYRLGNALLKPLAKLKRRQ